MGKLLLLQFTLTTLFQNISYLRGHLNTKSYTQLMTIFSATMNCELINNFNNFQLSPCKLLTLPMEEIRENYVRRNVRGAIFSFVNPSPLHNPKMVSYSEDALRSILNLDPNIGRTQEFIDFIAGNKVLDSSIPISHRYGGHQFGYWAMQLGDGRAIILGEFVNSEGERWELQLKGAGKTPYSRDGDGRAVLRSSIREYLCSEAMYYLGIPTSRAAAVVVSGDQVVRDLLYDGHPRLEPVAVVLRLAPSWFRIGSFELLAKSNELDLLNTLFDFILKEHFPDIEKGEDSVLEFLSRVFRTNADMVIGWQAVGFTHGVLNTDNISLLGITIDYGPFGFMEAYDKLYVPNHSDTEARYCYGRQTQIIMLNLLMLTKALSPIMTKGQMEKAARLLQSEAKYVDTKLVETFSKKLGFITSEPELVEELLNLLEETKADFALALRQLGETPLPHLEKPSSDLWALKTLSKHNGYVSFIKEYVKKLKAANRSDEQRMEQMCKLNPRYILRNWMAQEAIEKAESGNYDEVNLLLRILKKPFTKQEEAESKGYASKPPSWAKTLQLSCSS